MTSSSLKNLKTCHEAFPGETCGCDGVRSDVLQGDTEGRPVRAVAIKDFQKSHIERGCTAECISTVLIIWSLPEKSVAYSYRI
jgi:hypothetical protein